MTRISVKASENYDVIVAKGLLEDIGKLTVEVMAPCKALIVSDDIVSVVQRHC